MALAWTVGGIAAVQVAFSWIEGLRINERVHDWWWHGYEGWTGSLAHRALDRLGHIVFDVLPSATATALVATLVALPLAFLARTIARAGVRAGHADPLDRAHCASPQVRIALERLADLESTDEVLPRAPTLARRSA